jgi:hypothetical protein
MPVPDAVLLFAMDRAHARIQVKHHASVDRAAMRSNGSNSAMSGSGIFLLQRLFLMRIICASSNCQPSSYEKIAAKAAREGLDHIRFLLRLVELELIDREQRMVERRIRAARFPAVKISTHSTSPLSHRSTSR